MLKNNKDKEPNYKELKNILIELNDFYYKHKKDSYDQSKIFDNTESIFNEL
jgi:hypothetical protein